REVARGSCSRSTARLSPRSDASPATSTCCRVTQWWVASRALARTVVRPVRTDWRTASWIWSRVHQVPAPTPTTNSSAPPSAARLRRRSIFARRTAMGRGGIPPIMGCGAIPGGDPPHPAALFALGKEAVGEANRYTVEDAAIAAGLATVEHGDDVAVAVEDG